MENHENFEIFPDIFFQFKKSINNCRSYAARSAVLWPLAKRRSFKSGAVTYDTRNLITSWRDRVITLANTGLEDFRHSAKYIRNCLPAFVYVDNRNFTVPCGRFAICPWCYARKVEADFDHIASVLPERGKLVNPARFITIKSKLIMTKKEAGSYVDTHFHSWREAPATLCKRLKPFGAAYFASLDPFILSSGKTVWRYVYRVLARIEQDAVLPAYLYSNNKQVKDIQVSHKKQLVRLIGQTYRYPTGLFWSDPEMTIMALNARRGRRCSAMIGKFRKKSEDSDGS